MAYYDKIANQWHKITGYAGGAFKKQVLNERILNRIKVIEGKSILELGAGNGYFIPMFLRKFSGQKPSQIWITDISGKLLEQAKKHFTIEDAQYCQLDVRGEFPFVDNSIDLILATMVFNELSNGGMKKALLQCCRVLAADGQCIITVLHPAFIENMAKRKVLDKIKGKLTMPGTDGVRVPVVIRSIQEYEKLFKENGFEEFESEEIYATEKVLKEKPGLSKAGNVPIAMIFDCKNKTKEGFNDYN